MANKRILTASEALFVGPSPATGSQATANIQQISRVQSIGYDFSKSLEDVNQAGNYAPIDRVALQLPTVSLNVSYLATNVANESGIGLYVGGDLTALKNILDGSQADKNYYLRVVPDGVGANGYTGTDGGVVGFGNGVVASYQARGQVGGFPTASFTVQALDGSWVNTSSGFDTPAINPVNGQPISAISVVLPVATTGQAGQLTALQPGDITVDLNGAGVGINSICIQSYDISADLNLDPIVCLGSKYPTSREIQFPVNSKFSVEANMRDLGTGRLSSLQCGTQKYDMSVTLRAPTCDGSTGTTKAVYYLKQAVLEGQQFNNSVGGKSQSVTLNFSAPIGGPTETTIGLFISGSLT